MKKLLIFTLGIVLYGCFGKSSIPDPVNYPIDPIDPNIKIDTVCTVCNQDSLAILDSIKQLNSCDIVFGQPDHEVSYSPASQKIRLAFYNFLKTNAAKYDNNLMMYLGSKDSTIYCYRQGKYNTDTPLSIMSASKLVTATVIMTLVEDGKLSLDDRVSKYIPSFKSVDKQTITIRQLMSHTSGIIADSPYDLRGKMTLEHAVDSIALRTKLLFIPGTSSTYGSSAFKIASRVAEVIEKKAWAQVFQERIGSKCGLENMIYSPDNILNPATGSGIICTMNEYLRFLNMFYNNGTYKGVKVLAKASVEIIEGDNSNQVNDFYGLGIFRYDIVNNVSTEVACPSASGVHAWINREKNYYGLVFTQAGFDKTIESNLAFRKLVYNQLGSK